MMSIAKCILLSFIFKELFKIGRRIYAIKRGSIEIIDDSGIIVL